MVEVPDALATISYAEADAGLGEGSEVVVWCVCHDVSVLRSVFGETSSIVYYVND